MANPLEVSFLLNDQTYHGAYAEHLKYRFKLWIYGRSILCIICVIFGGYLLAMSSRTGLAYIFIAGGVLGFLRPVIWQMWHERGARKNLPFGTEIHYIFNEDGVRISGTLGTFFMHWDEIIEIVTTTKGVLLYREKKSYLWIPKVAFKNDEMQLISTYKSKYCPFR